ASDGAGAGVSARTASTSSVHWSSTQAKASWIASRGTDPGSIRSQARWASNGSSSLKGGSRASSTVASSSPCSARSRKIRSGSLPLMNSDGSGVKPTRHLSGADSAGAPAAACGAAAPSSRACSFSCTRLSAAPSASPPCSATCSSPPSTSTASSSASTEAPSSRRLPARASSRSVSSRWVRSVTARKPKVAAPPLIEWAARNTTLIVSRSGSADSRRSRPASMACRPSRLSSKNAAWKRLMSMVGPSAQHLAHGGDQLGRLERLDQPAGGTGGAAFLLLVGARLGGQHQQRGELVGGQLAQLADQLDPVHPRHVDVGDHGVELLPLRLLQCRLAVLGLVHGVAGRRQGEGDHLPHGGGIVDDQQLCAHAFSPVVLA